MSRQSLISKEAFTVLDQFNTLGKEGIISEKIVEKFGMTDISDHITTE